MGTGFKFEAPGLKDTTKELAGLRTELEGIRKATGELHTSRHEIVSYLRGIKGEAEKAEKSVSALGKGLGGLHAPAGGGRGSGPVTGGMGAAGAAPAGGFFGGSSGGSNYNQGAVAQAIGSLPVPGAGGAGIADVVQDLGQLMVKPLQLAYNRVEENRIAALRTAGAFGGTSMRWGASGDGIRNMMTQFADRIPIRGTLDHMLQATQLGTQLGFGMGGDNADQRAGGFWTAARQYQQLNPLVSAPQVVGELGGFMRNANAVQTSVMFSGGAFNFQKAGGGQKSLQEWADGLLNFFQGQRPGRSRGKPFTREELLAQQFPGSNINTWFDFNGVTPGLQDAFWQYAIGKATTGGGSFEDIVRGTRGQDMAYERLRGETAMARRDFHLMGQQPQTPGGQETMYESYVWREKVDRRFQEILNKFIEGSLSQILGTYGFNQGVASLPTPISEMLYKFTTAIPQWAGSALGSIPLIGGTTGASAPGMAGDPGWGPYGSTTGFGLTPQMDERLGAMMAANPNLSITSGYRDGSTQSRLFAGGVGATAPAGHSMHATGMAADIGPESEYGWIAANAHKFGLHTAGHMGEPWHVGIPGTIPMGDPRRGGPGIGDTQYTQNPDGSWNVTGGNVEPDNLMTWGYKGSKAVSKVAGAAGGALGTIADLVQMISPISGALKLAGGAFSGVKSLMGGNLADLFGAGGLFDVRSLMGNVGQGLLGLIPGMGNLFQNPLGATLGFLGKGASNLFAPSQTDWASSLSSGGGGGGQEFGGYGGEAAGSVASIMQKYNLPTNAKQRSVSGGQAENLRTALDAMYKAGFRGEDLVYMGAVAGRESGWNPRAHNGNAGTGDNSHGLFQINMLGKLGPARRSQYGLSSNSELFDPYVNSRIAFDLYGGGSGRKHWNEHLAKRRAVTAQFVQPVYDQAKNMGMIGDPGMMARVMQLSSPSSFSASSMTSAPTVNVSMPVSVEVAKSDGDLRRVAQVVARNLGEEVQNALVRHG